MADQTPQRGWHYRQLKWSLQALAESGSPQVSLFSDAPRGPDDLAFAFDHWSSLVRDEYGFDLTLAQETALDALADRLRMLSRDGAEYDTDVWTEAALSTSDQWSDVRELAQRALEAFGWNPDNEGSA